MPINRKPRPSRNPNVASQIPNFTLGAEASNARNILVTFPNAPGRMHVVAYLSSDANGDVVHATAPQSGWAVGANGSLLATITTNKMAHWLTEADGTLNIVITDTGTYTCYLNVCVGGAKFTSAAIAFA